MACQSSWDPDQQYIEARIKWAIRRLIGRCRILESDVDDLGQDFRLDLLRRLSSFSPQRSHRRTFLSRLIDNKVQNIIEERTAKKRDFRKNAYSLDDELEDGNGGTCARVDLQGADDYKRRYFGPQITGEALLELRIDLRLVIRQFSAQHQKICERIGEGQPIADIARDLKMSRSTIYSRLGEIRRRLAGAGYGSEKVPDTSTAPPVSR